MRDPHAVLTRDDRSALAALATTLPLGQRTVERLERRCGALAAALSAPAWELAAAGLSGDRLARVARAARVDGAALLSLWAARGWRFVAHDDAAFPHAWRSIDHPPAFVLVDGDVQALASPLVAVIGTRAVTDYGAAVARTVAERLAERGVGTVAGLAVGIDTAAHEATLAAGARTVAVLPSGFDRFYPARNLPLARRIVTRGGALVTEVAPAYPPAHQRFVARNRLVAALARAVVVVEAGERSGTMTTVQHALDQGRDVLAVPGPIDSPVSRGTNRLIADGATPLWDLAQLDAYAQSARTDGEDDPILRALCAGATDVVALQERTGLPPQELLARLGLLEVAGAIRRNGEQILPCGRGGC